DVARVVRREPRGRERPVGRDWRRGGTDAEDHERAETPPSQPTEPHGPCRSHRARLRKTGCPAHWPQGRYAVSSCRTSSVTGDPPAVTGSTQCRTRGCGRAGFVFFLPLRI